MLPLNPKHAWPYREAALACLMWDTPLSSCAIMYGCTVLKGQGSATDEKPQFDQPIETMCVDLIDAATQLSAACHFGSQYTYGYMTNSTAGPDSHPYVVALGDDNSDSCGSQ